MMCVFSIIIHKKRQLNESTAFSQVLLKLALFVVFKFDDFLIN